MLVESCVGLGDVSLPQFSSFVPQFLLFQDDESGRLPCVVNVLAIFFFHGNELQTALKFMVVVLLYNMLVAPEIILIIQMVM